MHLTPLYQQLQVTPFRLVLLVLPLSLLSVKDVSATLAPLSLPCRAALLSSAQIHKSVRACSVLCEYQAGEYMYYTVEYTHSTLMYYVRL